MPKPFSERLEAYVGTLNHGDRALANMDLKGVSEAARRATEEMVGMLQDLDGRLERVERRPANDA